MRAFDRLGTHYGLVAAFLTIALTLGPSAAQMAGPGGLEGSVSPGLSEEGRDKGPLTVDPSELEAHRRRRAAMISRDVEIGNDLRRREVHYRQERIGPMTFGIWDNW